MNIIVLGAGSVGLHLAQELSTIGHDVKVVDTDKSRLARIEESCEAQCVHGSASDLMILEKTGIKTCDLLLATTSNDEANMLSCLLAKNIAPVTTIARLRKDFYFQGYKTFYRNKMGIDLIVCPEILAALEIVCYTKELKSSIVETLADGNIEVKTIKVSSDFKYKDCILNSVPFPKDILVSGVVRDGKLIIPRGNDKISEGDILYVIGKTEAVEHMGGVFDPKKERWFFSQNETAFVLGGGRIGIIVAKMLSMRGIKVKLIEENAAKCKAIAEMLPDVLVFNEDATNDQFLHEEGVESASYFISTCKRVETGIMASLLAREMGAKEIISIVDEYRYHKVLERLGITNIVNPRMQASKSILEFIKNDNMLIHNLGRFDYAHLVEIYTDDNFPLKNQKIRDIHLPQNTLICSIQRGEEVFIPKGDNILEGGDIVVIFTIGENLDFIRKAFIKG